MSMLQLVPNSQTVETKLTRMKELQVSAKMIEAELAMLKKEVITEYFATNEEYRTSKGLLLASYKESIRTQFKTTEFKKEHASLYDAFCDLIPVKTFLLK